MRKRGEKMVELFTVVGRRTLRFPDNTKVTVKGLDDIMAELYAENKKANSETAREIIKKLKEKKNFIPSSESVHREYAFVLLQEYRKYIEKYSDSDS
jgi:thiamine kinase-like enzyme